MGTVVGPPPRLRTFQVGRRALMSASSESAPASTACMHAHAVTVLLTDASMYSVSVLAFPDDVKLA